MIEAPRVLRLSCHDVEEFKRVSSFVESRKGFTKSILLVKLTRRNKTKITHNIASSCFRRKYFVPSFSSGASSGSLTIANHGDSDLSRFPRTFLVRDESKDAAETNDHGYFGLKDANNLVRDTA